MEEGIPHLPLVLNEHTHACVHTHTYMYEYVCKRIYIYTGASVCMSVMFV